MSSAIIIVIIKKLDLHGVRASPSIALRRRLSHAGPETP
jgi:hypothetical protein